MSAGDFIRAFYELRRANDPELLRPLIAEDVIWREPTVARHMGELIGADAVLDMLRRALATTSGTFSLHIAELIEVAGHCAATVAWSAIKDGVAIHGRELATFTVRDGQIAYAQFLPENISNDETFWAG